MKKRTAIVDLDYLFDLENESKRLKELSDLIDSGKSFSIKSKAFDSMAYGSYFNIGEYGTKIITIEGNELKKEFDKVMDSLREVNKGQRKELDKLRKKKWYQFVKL